MIKCLEITFVSNYLGFTNQKSELRQAEFSFSEANSIYVIKSYKRTNTFYQIVVNVILHYTKIDYYLI